MAEEFKKSVDQANLELIERAAKDGCNIPVETVRS